MWKWTLMDDGTYGRRERMDDVGVKTWAFLTDEGIVVAVRARGVSGGVHTPHTREHSPFCRILSTISPWTCACGSLLLSNCKRCWYSAILSMDPSTRTESAECGCCGRSSPARDMGDMLRDAGCGERCVGECQSPTHILYTSTVSHPKHDQPRTCMGRSSAAKSGGRPASCPP